jgi:RNA polymerase-binding transcription factor DksA
MNTHNYQELLQAEKKRLESELADVGYKNPSNPADWQPAKADMDAERSDVIDTADNAEEFRENAAVVETLEVRLHNVDAALARIEAGKYGTCKTCSAAIEEDRLTANPAADTCKAHMA